MNTYLIDVPIPSMGATVSELTVIDIKVAAGARIAKGDKIAELESDKSVFEFEAPCDGVVELVQARAGDILPSGSPFLRISTADISLKNLQVKASVALPLVAALSTPPFATAAAAVPVALPLISQGCNGRPAPPSSPKKPASTPLASLASKPRVLAAASPAMTSLATLLSSQRLPF